MNKYKIIFESNLSWDDKIKLSENLALHEINKSIYINIKDFFGNYTIWSKFKNCYKNLEGKWEKRIVFYYHNLENVDFNNDWRFKEVKGKRKVLEFLELEFHENTFKLPKNHIKDYLKYLEKYETRK